MAVGGKTHKILTNKTSLYGKTIQQDVEPLFQLLLISLNGCNERDPEETHYLDYDLPSPHNNGGCGDRCTC